MLVPLLLSCLATAPVSPDSAAKCIALAPAEALRVTVDGPSDGRPVVIIPGLISPAYAFRKVLPPLAEAGVRAIVIEPLGVGQSSRPGDADYSHTAQAARIAAVMDSLGVRHAVVMGQAVGTAIALRLTLARPDLVDRLLLVEGGPLESAAVPGVKKALKFSFLIRLFAGNGRIKKELRKGLMASSGDTTWVTDELIEHYTEGSAGDIGAVLRVLKGMQKAVEPDSLTPRLDEVGVPVKLLIGGASHEGGPSAGRIRAMQRRLPHFSMQVVYGAGLHIQEEQPDVLVQDLLAMAGADKRS